MTNEERDLIAKFVARVGGQPQSGGFMSGSVPASQPQLPPIDREADDFIAQQFQSHPEARYRITQTAIVQEAALAEASNRIQRLQWELDQAKQAIQQAPNSQQSKGFFSSLFGGGGPSPQAQPGGGAWNQGAPRQGGYYQPSSPPPQPQYPPSYQPGMFGRGGSGFLGSALTTAAGVAGGMVVGDALMNAFSGSHGAAAASPWGSNTSDQTGSMFDGSGVVPTDPTGGGYATDTGYSDPFAGGGADKDFGSGGGMDQQTSWDGGGFDSGGGGFDQGGGGFDDNT